MNSASLLLRRLSLLAVLATLTGCNTLPRPGTVEPRRGDEIVVAGQFVHTATPVVLWMDPGGYDAYRVERRFSPLDKAGWESSHAEVKGLDSPNRYNMRRSGLTNEEIERVRGGGWDLPTLQGVVDQFVIHFDVCGTSRQCFNILQDHRDLSVHFMLDLDGTIYQTLDVKERAWHATTSNNRSVGIEIANMGAYGVDEKNPFDEWYAKGANGGTRITIPERFGDGGIRTKGFVGHPARPEPVVGTVQGRELIQYDFTPEQYRALSHLTAALCKVLPKIDCDYPKDSSGKLITSKLPEAELKAYEGVLGHFHVQTDKIDPGPAFQWDHVIDDARKLIHGGMSEAADETSKGHMRARW
ncbi:MAG TPA: peptidoglycan recognition family protein [Candidatus Acidoferrum sp.]|jgi:N-acetylmuramoyl-L-alanine amidase|nr:peptidoglycan recognition family protein [Candidatus Acidoferrum sp.]